MINPQLELFPNTSKQEIIQGDCLEVMRSMAESSIDFICTDPPYGLHFMGKDWDKFKKSNFDESNDYKQMEDRSRRAIYSANANAGSYDENRNDEFQEFMRLFGIEALRVLKPGGMMAMFGAPRRHHRQMSGLEDAGFEIRDVIAWIFGQGFPKSLDVSKAIDKKKHSKEDSLKVVGWIKERCKNLNIGLKELNDICETSRMAEHFFHHNSQSQIPTKEQWEKLEKVLGEPPACMKELIQPAFSVNENYLKREIIKTTGSIHLGSGNTVGCFTGNQRENKPISDLAKTFSGYGTALKPAVEIIVLAMKPLDGTFAQNAEKWGVAGINVDESRLETKGEPWGNSTCGFHDSLGRERKDTSKHTNANLVKGRWPSNLILDEESAAELDQMTGNNVSRFFYCAKASSSERNKGLEGLPDQSSSCNLRQQGGLPKANNEFKVKNSHPTVKPIALMKYILKLLAPPGNPICLDPFSGSGSTLCAAKELDISCIGIEKESEYVEIARKRIEGNNVI